MQRTKSIVKTPKSRFLFFEIPNEVLLLVMDYLDLTSLVQFMQSTKKMFDWSKKNDTIWKKRCLQYVKAGSNTWSKNEDEKLEKEWRAHSFTSRTKRSWWLNKVIEYHTLHGPSSYFNKRISPNFSTWDDCKTLNIVAIGAGATGKTQTIERFAQGTYIDKYDPTIEGSYLVGLSLKDKHFQLDMLDTAGQEEYSALRDNYIRRADGILLFYSIATRSSFEQCHKLRSNILRMKNDDTNFPVILVGAKCDLPERAVMTIEGVELAKKWNMSFLEVSPKNDYNIKRLFERMTLEVANYILMHPSNKKKQARRSKKCLIM